MTNSGVPYERIAFVSFSRATIKNVKDRLDLTKDQAQYFRTIHGMNFFLLGIKKEQLAHQHLHTFPARFTPDFLSYEAKKTDMADTVTATDSIDENFYKQMMEERKQLLPRDYVPPQYAKSAGLYLNFKKRYFEWLQDNDYIDFMGLLEQGIESGKLPPVDLLCVDEWQDLTPLQVKQITFWSQNIPLSVHAGDDDQTIHEWAGASHQDFLDFPTFSPTENKTVILDRTYRLPTRILDMSVEFIKRNKKRVDKQFVSAKSDPGIIEMTNIDKVAEVLREQLKLGSCKVLVRNNALRSYLIKDLLTRGIPVNTNLKPTVEAVALMADKKNKLTIQELYMISDSSAFHGTKHFNRGGKKGLKLLADMLSASGEKTISVGDLINYKVKPNLIEALQSGDYSILHTKQLNEAVKIFEQFGANYNPVEIMTIHASKGTEADTVVVCLDVTKRTYRESRDPSRVEEERRVWYVAMTRTKKNLLFLVPSYRGFYPSPMTDYVKLYLKHEQCS